MGTQQKSENVYFQYVMTLKYLFAYYLSLIQRMIMTGVKMLLESKDILSTLLQKLTENP